MCSEQASDKVTQDDEGCARVDLASSGDERDLAPSGDAIACNQSISVEGGSQGPCPESKTDAASRPSKDKPPPWRREGQKKSSKAASWEDWLSVKWSGSSTAGWQASLSSGKSRAVEGPSWESSAPSRRYSEPRERSDGNDASSKRRSSKTRQPSGNDCGSRSDAAWYKKNRTIRVFGVGADKQGLELVQEAFAEAQGLEMVDQGTNAIFVIFQGRGDAVEAMRRFDRTSLTRGGAEKILEVRMLKGHDPTRKEEPARSRSLNGRDSSARRASRLIPRDMSPISRFAAGMLSPSSSPQRAAPFKLDAAGWLLPPPNQKPVVLSPNVQSGRSRSRERLASRRSRRSKKSRSRQGQQGEARIALAVARRRHRSRSEAHAGRAASSYSSSCRSPSTGFSMSSSPSPVAAVRSAGDGCSDSRSYSRSSGRSKSFIMSRSRSRN